MKRRILCLTLLSLLQFVLVHFLLIQRFPNSGDEQSYLFQAKLFSNGQLCVEDSLYDRAHPLNKYIEADAINDIGGRRFSKYPPGWPALLLLGVKLRTEWLAGPLLGALTVFLLLSYTKKRIGHEYVGTTWWLLTLCPFFFLSVASFGSHTSTMAFLFGAFYLYDDALARPPGRYHLRLFAAGLLLGYSALIRYIDWIPLLGWIALDLLRQKRIKGVALLVLGFALLSSFDLLYNKLLTGGAMITPADLYAKGGLHDHLVASWAGFKVTAVRLGRLVYVFPPAALLALWVVKSWHSGRLKVLMTLFGLNVGVYFFYVGSVGGPGPRYLFPYFPFLILAVVEVVRLTRGGLLGRRAWAFVGCSQIVCGLAYAAVQTHEIYERMDLERTVATIHAARKIILLQTGTYKMELRDLIRNPPDLWSADTLYFAYGDGVGIANLLKRFPEHSVYIYRYPGSLTAWSGSERVD